MGLFDRMFGKGAKEDSTSTQRFDELKNKYQTVLSTIDQQQIRLQNLHIEGDKLYIRGIAPSQDAINRVWDQVKLVDPNYGDITLDLEARESQAQGATANAQGQSQGQAAQTYTVQAGDTLSKISKQFYGDSNEYMRIFYANRDKLSDPNKIQVGQQLSIPPDTDA